MLIRWVVPTVWGQSRATQKVPKSAEQEEGRSAMLHHVEQVSESFYEFVEYAKSLEETAFEAQAKIEQLNKTNIAQGQEIADLKATISQFQAQTTTQPTTPETLIIENIEIKKGHFSDIPQDNENGGMLREKDARPVEAGGKYYEERLFLRECKLQVPGQQCGEIVEHNGMSFVKIIEGDVEKLIQVFEPSSLVQCEGKYFLKWVTLKEKHYYGV
jgi:hypothetical protein